MCVCVGGRCEEADVCKRFPGTHSGSGSLRLFPEIQDHMLMFAMALPEVTLDRHLGPLFCHKLCVSGL